MSFIKNFICSALILSSAGYASTLTLQVESDEQQLSSKRLKPSYEQVFFDNQDYLKKHLPLQVKALETLQKTFQTTIDAQKEQNPLEAFKAACSLANLQTLIGSTQDILSCIQAEDSTMVSIGIGAAPAVKQGIDQLIMYLNDAVDCSHLKELSKVFQEITRDICNPEISID
jgi:hypothetical protein